MWYALWCAATSSLSPAMQRFVDLDAQPPPFRSRELPAYGDQHRAPAGSSATPLDRAASAPHLWLPVRSLSHSMCHSSPSRSWFGLNGRSYRWRWNSNFNGSARCVRYRQGHTTGGIKRRPLLTSGKPLYGAGSDGKGLSWCVSSAGHGTMTRVSTAVRLSARIGHMGGGSAATTTGDTTHPLGRCDTPLLAPVVAPLAADAGGRDRLAVDGAVKRHVCTSSFLPVRQWQARGVDATMGRAEEEETLPRQDKREEGATDDWCRSHILAPGLARCWQNEHGTNRRDVGWDASE
jgi:hypothetical protein